jgi:hypothetical protein
MQEYNAGSGRIGVEAGVLALKADGKKAIEIIDNSLTDPRRKKRIPCTKGVIVTKSL